MSILTKETIVSHLESEEEFPISLSDVWEWLGYSKKDNALQAFRRLELVEGQDFQVFLANQENSRGGRPSQEILLSVDSFKGWSMAAQTLKGKEVRAYYLQVEKEWKTQKSAIPQVSAEQIEAFQFQKDIYFPWVSDNPVAATVFMEWQGITSALPPQMVESAALSPSIEAMAALDGAFLNLNRSGLMLNKLFKFLDRIPTMKSLDKEFVDDLVAGLSESERLRSGLELELEGVLSRMRKLNTEHQKLAKQKKLVELELEKMHRKCDGCNVATPVDSIVCRGSVPKQLKSAI